MFDERSDLYSLAIVLYELLVGRPPFTAENEHALMTSHLQTPPPPLTGRVQGLDPQVEPALMRALAKNPEERFASVEEFGRAIGAAAIRGDAADILQDFVAPIFRDTPARTRLVNAPSDIVSRPNRGSDAGAKRSLPRRRGLPLPWPKTLPSGLRLPVAILGGVALALGLSWDFSLCPPRDQAHLPNSPRPTPQNPPRNRRASRRPCGLCRQRRRLSNRQDPHHRRHPRIRHRCHPQRPRSRHHHQSPHRKQRRNQRLQHLPRQRRPRLHRPRLRSHPWSFRLPDPRHLIQRCWI